MKQLWDQDADYGDISMPAKHYISTEDIYLVMPISLKNNLPAYDRQITKLL
jgi:hypothetical protein